MKIKQSRSQTLQDLLNRQKRLQDSLTNIFKQFLDFENRSQQIKNMRSNKQNLQKSLTKFRKGVFTKEIQNRVLTSFQGFLINKNMLIFWKNCTNIKYQKLIIQVQQQLSKLNKKKKTFLQKSQKSRQDIQKRIQQQSITHLQIYQNVQFFRKKYLRILNYYINRHYKLQNNYYKQSIFNAWKKQYQGTKRLVNGINRVLQRNLVYSSYQKVLDLLRKTDSRMRSQQIIIKLLQKRSKLGIKDAWILWRAGILDLKCRSLTKQITQKIQQHQFIKIDCQQKSQLISRQTIRKKKQKLLIQTFMAIKNPYIKLITNKRKIKPLLQKINHRLVITSINGWKWLMFYKKTKRRYLQFKKSTYNKQLKKDVFNSLKIYRMEIYQFVNLIDRFTNIINNQYLKFALNKIINIGAHQKNQLNYQRKRSLHCLLMNKITKIKLIKTKILTKWHAWLIPRTHYLPSIINQVKTRIVRSAMASIKARMYWNEHYAKQSADKVTSQGYSDINTITSGLLKSGFDPDEVKAYLKKRNAKDNIILQRVVSHMKTWGQKQSLVRSWHSWLEYVDLKKKIRTSLRKILNVVGGLGKYWNRWRGSDKKFANLLQKQSRGNMLNRYRQLNRLLKQYHRDLKDSSQYCQELKNINSQYIQANQMGLQMALSVFSSNMKSALRQGLRLWRDRVKQIKRSQMDHKYQQLCQGISLLNNQRNQLRYKLAILRQQNKQFKQKCIWGGQCGKILQKLLTEKDILSIDLADKQHNLKLLLEDNLRLKQKLRIAQNHAETLLKKVQSQK